MTSPPHVESLPFDLDQFTLVERLATGGMADVYLAVERKPLGGPRWVAIKRIRADLLTQPEFIEYFVTEGRVSLACHHPNLPIAYHLGAVNRRPYLALEYIAGPTLLSVVRAADRHRRPVGLSAVLAVALGVARALEHLHTLTDVRGRSLDVIHRDVTPQNLLIAPGGVVKLIDFGVARAAVQTHRTQVGVVKGKYAYIAPEQLDRGRLVDQRADLFSWGVVVHELITGQPLFHGKSDLDTCDRIKNAPIPDPSAVRPELPPDVGAVVRTALARDPDARWPDATALCDALERAARAAGVWPWPSRLEAETRALVGAPRLPVLGDGGVTWREGAAPTPHDDGAGGEVTPVIESRGEDGAWEEAAPRVPGDPQLTYFLRAGAVVEPWQGGDSSGVGEP